MDERLFPPPPPRTPPGYLSLPLSYRLQVVAVGLAILAFVAVYAACVGATGAALYWVVTHRPPAGMPIFITLGWVGVIIALGLALLVMAKGLFIHQAQSRHEWIELLPSREPVFFAFLARLAKEVRAPVPKRVFLAADVRAAVFHDATLLSLIWPPRKQLVLGLGLVNSLDLRELKAVLAHELGHFSQSSMSAGRYVYFAKRILAQLVHGRDVVDGLIDDLRFSERMPLAVVGYTANAIVEVLRAVLRVMHRAVLLSDLALSREMELNADRVAISSAGSAAFVSMLGRIEFGDACLAHALGALAHAADHELHTSDLYAHQLHAAEALPDSLFRPEWSRLDETLDATRPPIFPRVDGAQPSMWSTHPPTWQREAQARAAWIDAPSLESDRRAAWALFADADGLRQRMTMQITRAAHQGRALRFSDVATVERFLAEEREGAKVGARYHGVYDQRAIAPTRIDAIVARAAARAVTRSELASEWDALYGPSLAAHVSKSKQCLDELDGLARVSIEAQLEGRTTFTFRGFPRPVQDVADLTRPIQAELERESAWRDAWDERVAATHARMALELDGDTGLVSGELRARYAAHLVLQQLVTAVVGAQELLGSSLAIAHAPVAISPWQEERAMATALEARAALAAALERASTVRIPTIPGLPLERGLAQFLLPVPVLSDPRLVEATLERELLAVLARQHADVLDRLARVRKRSLAALVAQQEQIVEQWRARGSASASDAVGAA